MNILFFDLETTGTDIGTDRICQIAMTLTDGKLNVIEEFSSLVNPEMKISEGANSIHGISDSDVMLSPKFSDIASKVYSMFNDSHIAGHNILRFDIPIITRQLAECGFVFNPYRDDRKVIDTYQNEVYIHPRTLKGCYEFYYGDSGSVKFHDAIDDVRACIDILKKQAPIIKERNLSMTDIAFNGTRPAESSNSFVWKDNEIIFNFGKHKGKVAKYEKDYLRWYLTQSINPDTRELVNLLLK